MRCVISWPRLLLGGENNVAEPAEVGLQARTASQFGVELGNVHVNFGKVMERMRELRAKMSTNDSAKRFAKLGIDVYQVVWTVACLHAKQQSCLGDNSNWSCSCDNQ